MMADFIKTVSFCFLLPVKHSKYKMVLFMTNCSVLVA